MSSHEAFSQGSGAELLIGSGCFISPKTLEVTLRGEHP